MTLIEPFRALRVVPTSAARVAAPPYDVVNTEEARSVAAENPDSFLHVSKPEIDFAPGTDEHSAQVYARGKENLDRLVADGLLVLEPAPCLYLYRLVMGTHTQTGLVGAVAVEAYRDGRLKLHEHTNPQKVDDRARNADALDAHTGTLFLTYPAQSEVDAVIERLTAAPPEIDFTADDGVCHSVWVVRDDGELGTLAGAFNAMPAVYIADGHHRSAAAEKLHEWRSAMRARGETVGPADRFLAVLFPDDQVQILSYNRVVTTVGDRTAAELIDELEDAFMIEPSPHSVEPEHPGVFGLYVDGAWYRMQIRPELVPADALARLDINLLERNCLAPLFGIEDQRNDARIDFVGGIRGLGELERRVDSGEMKAAFALHATGLGDVFAVADRGEVMPTKSTWFEPKLRDGILVLPL